MKKILFLYSGEGTSNSESSYKLLKHSALWPQIAQILREAHDIDLEAMWAAEIGRHRCPASPLLTVVAEICLSDIWSRWCRTLGLSW